MLRMLRGPLSATAVLASLGALTGVQGCSGELPVQDLCTWMSDPSNCAARFAEDVGLQCGDVPSPDPAVSATENNTTGTFLARDKLDVCVRAAGGQVKFDPAFDMNAFPPAAFTFKSVTALGGDCGSGAYGGPLNFSVTVNTVDPADAAADPSTTGEYIQGGTYASAQEAGRDVFDVTCPGGQETHHFNQLTIQQCAELDPKLPAYLPHAIFDASGGVAPLDVNGTGIPGYVRLRVVYPPPSGVSSVPPVVIEYFNCAIPAPPNMCQDGMKDGTETDIDCGGNVCPTRCLTGAACAGDGDCQPGHQCIPITGILKCN
jgi:hypothetical protein